ncbi:T9SS type A sorting domain-containing protein [Lacinutrix jangbogonensis]|uniref:T9SS type A sorting domain-containing protein n=1 Tax=Lacinutrix jangbogonensis TaxID=1469557 RepID=UPI00053D618B|nr:T9SS type A sorting domain-containing protein [Lacinutrix jangbogonensis]
MKTKLLFLLFSLSIVLITNNLNAQTTLVAGDIAVIHVKTDDPDAFAFVTFVDLLAGTVIYFTNCGADADGFNPLGCIEGARKYTVPSGGIGLGTIIKSIDPNITTYTDAGIIGAMSFSTFGDQVLVFQDADLGDAIDPSQDPTFIFALNTASTEFTGSKANTKQTGLPFGLQDTSSPVTALGLGSGIGNQDDFDNVVYNSAYDFSGFPDLGSSIAAAKLALTDTANYLQEDDHTAMAYTTAVGNIAPALMFFTLSTESFSIDNALKLYPNPSHGLVTIRNSGIALEQVNLTDINGRVVASFSLNGITDSKQLNLSDLTSGLYLLTITSKEASTVKRLIIR